MLSKWDNMDYDAIITLLWPFNEAKAEFDERDQRASITFTYRIPSAGLDAYFEWARNDFSANNDFTITYPFHSQAYTVGANKSFTLNLFTRIKGRFNFELSNLESSRDYQIFPWYSSFYNHGLILQGYTTNGQVLGAGLGNGGNSQYLGVDFYYASGLINLFLQRVNPDNDYQWFMNTKDGLYRIFGFKTNIFFIDSRNYDYKANIDNIHRYNIHIEMGMKIEL